MAQIEIKNLSFSYPSEEDKVLDNISLEIEEGEYVVFCGKSGCGKTTLLRHLKAPLAPKGKKEGEIFIANPKVGFVMQDPENQIVTDKVWHEIVFGLENMGLSSDEAGLRMAEMATYFGIEDWLEKRTDSLSGGQKQMLNLASVMAMHPEIIILDEPTSQLDPVSAENFLSTLNRINKELGVTVIITEHRLEEIFPVADKVVVMDSGKIMCVTDARSLPHLTEGAGFISKAMPSAMRVYSQINSGECPLTVREGRAWLRSICPEALEIPTAESEKIEKYALSIKDVSFRYEKNSEDVLCDISMKIPQGRIVALTGGNGAGKSTLLRLLTGALKPYKGKIKTDKTIGALPQDARLIFTEKTVRHDLELMDKSKEKIDFLAKNFGIEKLLDKHPYDLSGGEIQKSAMAKLLLTDAEVLLLDEPTKGLDAEFKIEFSEILKELKNEGKTIVIVSHDVEFLALYSDYCAMLFDGKIVCMSETRSFFLSNTFYTTAAARMSRGIIGNALTCEDVIKCLKKK